METDSYQLSYLAEKDIESIYEYGIHQFGLNQARKYIIGLEATFKLLSQHSNIGKTVELQSNLQKFPYQQHIIFYQHQKSLIKVIRVLRKEMDAEQHL